MNVGQPGAREQYDSWRKYPSTYGEPKHAEWAASYDALRAQLDEARAELAGFKTDIDRWRALNNRTAADRDALRAAVEKHNAKMRNVQFTINNVYAGTPDSMDEFPIPLPPSAAPAASEPNGYPSDDDAYVGPAAPPMPRRHQFWGAGEADCPRDIKASNGELHSLRCKLCGETNPTRDCAAGTVSREAQCQELLTRVCLEMQGYTEFEWLVELIEEALSGKRRAEAGAGPKCDFCCIDSLDAARERAWRGRNTRCGCDHNESCDECFPPDFRMGGYWDQQRALLQQTTSLPEGTK